MYKYMYKYFKMQISDEYIKHKITGDGYVPFPVRRIQELTVTPQVAHQVVKIALAMLSLLCLVVTVTCMLSRRISESVPVRRT